MIRLGGAPAGANADADDPGGSDSFGLPRKGFDYRAFEGRLQALWFQRKAYLSNGRHDDAAKQGDRIVAFIEQEGIRRLPELGGALLAESSRFIEQGELRAASASLDLADRIDPDRPQTHAARAHLAWIEEQPLVAASRLGVALKSAALSGLRDFSLFNRFALVVVVAAAGAIFLFAVLMAWRYQGLFRHDVEMACEYRLSPALARVLGWFALFLPWVLWLPAGWIAFWWIGGTYRFMSRLERRVAIAVLVVAACSLPAYRLSVAAYSTTADPQIRTTIASAEGAYDPNRVLQLRRLVEASPDDAVYRFLLAELYKDGRFFEDAFVQYKEALALDPGMYQAHVNLGNIFFSTGQYAEAIARYAQALEIEPGSVVALFNLHLAQSEAFRFDEASAALERARMVDPDRLAAMLAHSSKEDGAIAADATLEITSVWGAALGGGLPRTRLGGDKTQGSLAAQLVNPVAIAAVLTLIASLFSLKLFPVEYRARQCIRCGDAYRPRRRRRQQQDAPEYCLQCDHLFVRGEGLAPGAKQRKLYEVERHERWVRRSRRLWSLLLPGSAQLLSGRALFGAILLLGWLAALIAAFPAALVPFERTIGADLRLDLLTPSAVPAIYEVQAFGVLAVLAAFAIWLVGNVTVRGRA